MIEDSYRKPWYLATTKTFLEHFGASELEQHKKCVFKHIVLIDLSNGWEVSQANSHFHYTC